MSSCVCGRRFSRSVQREIPNKKISWLACCGAALFAIFVCTAALNCYSQNCITIDFSNGRVELADFFLKNINIKGDFLFDIKRRQDGSLIFNLDGRDVWLKSVNLSWVKLRLTKEGDTIFIYNFSSPEFTMRGRFNLSSHELFFDINVNSNRKEELLEGKINANVKLWGYLGNCFASGSVDIADGRYQGVEFSRLMLNFLGKPPLLNLTDSRVILKDGSSYTIVGLLNIRDLRNLFPKAEFISQRVSFGDWKLLAEDKANVSLRKEIDGKFDVLFEASEKEDSPINRGTELRYKLQDDNFLRLRMEDNKSILGFERRKEF
jgi:hypothetical protein